MDVWKGFTAISIAKQAIAHSIFMAFQAHKITLLPVAWKTIF